MAPSTPPRTSALAVASLVLGVLACIPFIGALAAAMAAAALLKIRSSEGRLTGAAFASVGLAMGLFNLLISSIIALAFWVNDGGPPPPAPLAPPPVASAAPAPAAAGDEGGQMTTINEVTEVLIGGVRLIDVPPTRKSLEAELEDQRARAAAGRERLVLFTGAEGCRPCLSVAAALQDPKMQAALQRTRLVRVDVNALGQELEDLGVPTKKIPGFYLLGKDLSPTDGINGGEWGDDTADNAAPVLGAFVQGKLRKRAEPFVPTPRRPRAVTPRPGGTFL